MQNNSLVNLAREVLNIAVDFPFRVKNRGATTDEDFELVTFNQTWGSTALGFGGIGGQALTQARTYVFIPLVDGEECIVYFAGRYAYSCPYSKEFSDDVHNGIMEPVYRAEKYRKNS